MLAGVVALAASRAPAQQLRLDRPSGSETGEGKASLALADALIGEAEALLRESATPSPAARARAALRAAGADLLRAGEAEGGPRVSIIGRTIALRRRDLDGAIVAVGDLAPGVFVSSALALDLSRKPPLSDADGVERWMRAALWPLMRGDEPAPGAGWIVTDRTPARPLNELAALTDLGTDELLRVGAFEAALDGAASVPAYRPSAEGLRGAAASALSAMSHTHSRLLAPAVRQAVRDGFLACIAEFGASSADARVLAAGRLVRLGTLCEALVKAASLDPSNTAARVLRGAVEEFTTGGSWRDDATSVSRLELVIDVIDRSAPDPALSDERTLARQFKAAMRVIDPLARQSGAQTIEIAPKLLASAAAASDPAVLGAITAHARRMRDVRLLRAAADAIAEQGRSGDPEIPSDRRFLAERFVTLGQDLGKPERRDLAISELRDLCAHVGAWRSIDGEAELRGAAGDEGWRAATDSQPAELVGAIDRVRQEWGASWTTPRSLPAAATTRKLVVLRDNLAYLADAAGALNVGESRSRLNSWPGWELSREGASWLAAGLAETASAMTRALIAGDEDGVAVPRKRLTAELSLALTVGRLERRARDIGVASGADASAGALAQLALGPAPEDAWMFEARGELAEMCRAIEEAAHAPADPEGRASAARFKAAAELAARRVSLRLDTDETWKR